MTKEQIEQAANNYAQTSELTSNIAEVDIAYHSFLAGANFRQSEIDALAADNGMKASTTFILAGVNDALSETDKKQFMHNLSAGKTRVRHIDFNDLHLYIFTFTFWAWLRHIFKRKG